MKIWFLTMLFCSQAYLNDLSWHMLCFLQEMNPSDTENSKMSGWSERTRKVASYLSKSFQDAGKQKESGSVNLSQVSQGRTRKESARLFYEILVLKTTNYVDVQQNEAYGDIAVKKLPKLDKTFGV